MGKNSQSHGHDIPNNNTHITILIYYREKPPHPPKKKRPPIREIFPAQPIK